MSVSKRLRFEIFRRDRHACRYCGATASDAKLTIDHVTPTTLGGTDEPGNLVTACQDCNAGKTSSLPATLYVADVAEDVLARARIQRIENRPTDLVNCLLGHLDIDSDEQAQRVADVTRIKYEDDEEPPALSTLEWAVLGAVSDVVDQAFAFGNAMRGLLLQLPAETREKLARYCAAELTCRLDDDWSEYDLLHWMVRHLHVVGTRDPTEASTHSSDDLRVVK